ncbi:hypothetical protein L9F63_002117, partial [Diploptera punctata]
VYRIRNLAPYLFSKIITLFRVLQPINRLCYRQCSGKRLPEQCDLKYVGPISLSQYYEDVWNEDLLCGSLVLLSRPLACEIIWKHA